jgi:hypothetical protein
MAVSPEDLAAGALALQMFIKNAQYVEIIVNVAFGAIPSILGIGAAGLIGHGIINTAKEVRNSISLLKTVGPMAQLGWMAWKGRKAAGEWLKQKDNILLKRAGQFLTLPEAATSSLFNKFRKRRQETQDTQNKQEGKAGGGTGGNPPPPPDIKSDKKEEQAKIDGIPLDEYIKKHKKW